ncbi:unnamed protein product [Withania somnifera]
MNFPLNIQLTAQKSSVKSAYTGTEKSIAMANSVRIAAARMTSGDNLAVNFATCSCLVKEKASAGAKLLLFPENFSFVGDLEGESLKISEPLDGPIMRGYCSLARESNIWLSLGGFQEKGSDDAHLRNTHVLIDDNGNIRSTYSKTHLFDVDVSGGAVYKESSFTEAGEDIVVVDSPFGRLRLTVCYDLRFPELYQQLRFNHDAQVIAATQAGKHNEKRESYGDALVIDPWGTIVGRLSDRSSTGITVADNDFSLIDSVRAKIPVSKHRKPADFWNRSV